MKPVAFQMQSQTKLLAISIIVAINSWQVASHAVQAQEAQESPSPTAEQLRLFEARVHKVLVTKCYECHSTQSAKVEGGLLLDSRDSVRRGGDSGPAVVPGKLDESLLFQAISATKDGMPPGQPLSQEAIADIRTWIVEGGFDPREQVDAPEVSEPDYSQDRDYWAFRPLQSVLTPQVLNLSWPKDPIDNFILAKLEDVGLTPAAIATPEAIVRRVFFDLIGLPPTPAEVEGFVAKPSEQAYRDLIDRLLQRPEYGERWAQHWLDVVRYAETEGFEYDRTMPDIWRYRDYVIQALNRDMPYDQFLTEQLAGDEIAQQASNSREAELRIATGFFRLGAVRRNAGNQKVASSRNEVLTERTDIIGSAILGLTIGCARCHDHKFDPLSQKDYYRLQAFVSSTQEDNRALDGDAEQALQLVRTEQLEEEIGKLKELVANLDGVEEEKVKAKIVALEEQVPKKGPTICGVENDFANSSSIHVLRRGDPELPGQLVQAKLPSVLDQSPASEIAADHPLPRTQLVHQLLKLQSGLIARVIVNRVWQSHFGTGLVSTANDFGKNGSGASHPELLEHLSLRFVESSWSLKDLHRAIMLSATYRNGSQPMDAEIVSKVDPGNRLLAFYPQRRLSGEELRDAMLSISGQLNSKLGGASVTLPVEQELVDQLYSPTAWVVSSEPGQHARRSIYLFAKRNLRLPFMEVFDQPDAQTSCAMRAQSTHARQALELLNGSMTNELAVQFAKRLRVEAGSDYAQIVDLAYRLVASREPTEREMRLANEFLEGASLTEFALAMFNINAFLYVD